MNVLDYKTDDIHLMLGDCLKRMKEIPDNYIDSWITSPPYALQRDYNGSDSNNYIEWITPIMIETKRSLSENGNLFINIKEHCKNGQRDLYVYKFIIHMVEKIGFRFVDEFIWCKTNPFPTGSNKRLKDGFERILHFTKTDNYKFYPENCLIKSTSKWLESEKKRKNKGKHNTTNNSGMNMSKRISNDMVRSSNVITGSSSNINIDHPAVYPNYLPEFFIKLTTNMNDMIGDMFMGSGSTGVSALKNNRKFIGIELDPKYYAISCERIINHES